MRNTIKIFMLMSFFTFHYNFINAQKNLSASKGLTVTVAPDQSVDLCKTKLITLTGIAKSTTGGNLLLTTKYLWEKKSGPDCVIKSADQATATVTGMVPGTYVFRLNAENGTLSGYNETKITVVNTAFDLNVKTFNDARASANAPYLALYFLKAINPCEQSGDSAFSFAYAEQQGMNYSDPRRGFANYKQRILYRLSKYGITDMTCVSKRLPTGQNTALYESDFAMVLLSSATTVYVLGVSELWTGQKAYVGWLCGPSQIKCNFDEAGAWNSSSLINQIPEFLNPVEAAVTIGTSFTVPKHVNDRVQNLYPYVSEELSHHDPSRTKNIIFAGFDIAGSMTLLTAVNLAQGGRKIHAVYTFGSERLVMTPASQGKFDNYFYSADYVNYGDQIPKYPPLYTNPASKLFLFNSGGILTESTVASQLDFTVNDLANHKMNTYLQKLYNAYIATNPLYKDCMPQPDK